MKRSYIYLLFLIATLSLSGCICVDDLPECPGTMTIMLRTAATREVPTRAIGVNSQNAVKNLYMLAYDATSRKFLYYKKASSVVDSNSDGSIKYATFEYKPEEQHDNLTLRFYANVDGCTSISTLLSSLNSSSELDGTDAALECSLSSAWNTASDDDYAPIPMWGGLVNGSGKRTDAGVTLVKGNNDVNSITVNLMRALARVNVVVNGQGGYDGVKISSVKVYNDYNVAMVNPNLANMADDNTYKVKAPSTAGGTTTPLEYTFLSAEIACNNTIFIPEAEAGNTDHTYLIVSLTDGAYTRYVKLEFLDTDGEYIDILRSHSYTFRINTSEDSGLMGYSTEAEAINASEPYNRNAELDVVNDTYHNVMLTDETTVLYLYDDLVKIPLEGGSIQFMVYTNYADGWTISNYSDLQNNYPDFKFYKKDSPDANYLNGFVGLGNLNYYCTIELGPSSVNRDIDMRIDAGSIYKIIHVHQEP